MDGDWFEIIEHDKARVIELRLSDQMDSSYFDQLNEEILQQVDASDHDRWVIDLAKMRYVGSAVLGLMVNVRQRVIARGGRLTLCGVNRALASVLRTSALDRLFPVKKTRDEAAQ